MTGVQGKWKDVQDNEKKTWKSHGVYNEFMEDFQKGSDNVLYRIDVMNGWLYIF